MIDLHLDKPVRLQAPAKINLGLEITGRRSDGYHEIVTILQTIDLCDEIVLTPADHFSYTPVSSISPDDDLIVRMLDLVRARLGVSFQAHVELKKRIPITAGLGGGSSDAGTLLAAIAQYSAIPEAALPRIAAELGSDVPFFLRGGTAVATGTGTELDPLPTSSAPLPLVLVVPDIEISRKTATLYSSLTTEDFSDGTATRQLADLIRQGKQIDPALLQNAFARALYAYAPIRAARDVLLRAGATVVMPSGAGPSLIGIFPDDESATAALSDWPSDRRFLPRLVAAPR